MKAWLNKLLGKEETSSHNVTSEHYEAAGPGAFGQENNRLALELYASLRSQAGNLFFSPFSIRTALAMAFAGSAAETKSQLKQALHFSQFDELLHLEFAQLIQRLNAAGGGRYEMAVANALFGQEGSSLKDQFLEVVKEHYQGLIKLVDFRSDPDAVRAEINSWVEDKTRQRIQQLIPPRGLSGDSRLVLVNAVYFKGRWALPFEKRFTREEPFYLVGGKEVPAQLMHQQKMIRYARARGFQAVDLEYEGDDLSMLVLLPNKRDGLEDLENTISVRALVKCLAAMQPCEVKLYMPRFKIDWGVFNLRDELIGLGIKDAFDRTRADFSEINGLKPPHEDALFVTAVFHKAFVDVNEAGTEAAAATAVAMERAMAALNYNPPAIPIFRADHPFLFAIRDKRSKAILFLGRVADPR